VRELTPIGVSVSVSKQDTPGVIALPPLIYLAALVIGWVSVTLPPRRTFRAVSHTSSAPSS
jgi:hypothetical protein